MHPTIKQAITILNQGGLIGLPTETVYGLAADAKNDVAIKKIYHAKGRPTDHPLIVHIGSFAEVKEWAKEVLPEAEKLMQTFWPGPLTLILKKQANVSNIVTANQDSVGLRMPNHPIALEVLKAFGSGLAAPSANQFGHISPTSSQDVIEELDNQVDLVLSGGDAEIGIESTIVDARALPFTILRQGAVTKEMLEQTLAQEVLMKAATPLRVSGNLLNHYAPHTPLIILDQKELLNFAAHSKDSSIFLIHSELALPKTLKVMQLPNTPEAYAHSLYASLRQADHQNAELIILEQTPTGGLWDAINERLEKARKK